METGKSSREIHEEIERHYPFRKAPSAMTVYRHLTKLVKDKVIIESDDGYRLSNKSSASIKNVLNLENVPSHLHEDVVNALCILNRDPEDNQQHIKKVVDKLLSHLEDISYLIEFLKRWQLSPEVIAQLTRGSKEINDWWDKQEDPKELERLYWDGFDSIGNFRIISEEIT